MLNPGKTVLIRDLEVSCSLLDYRRDVRLMAKHPGVPVVTYVNSSAAVKAEFVTSAAPRPTRKRS